VSGVGTLAVLKSAVVSYTVGGKTDQILGGEVSITSLKEAPHRRGWGRR